MRYVLRGGWFFVGLLVALAPLGAEKSILAIPAIKGTDVSKSTVSACRNLVETALIRTGVFDVLSYTDIEEILEAQEFSLSDCTDESCAVEVGKLLAADKIVVGELSGLGTKMLLTLRLVDVATGKSLQAELADIPSVEEIQDAVFAAAYRLAGLRYVPTADTAVKEAGDLYVTAPEGRSLTVLLDGVERGRTPLLLEGVPFGVHILEAKGDDGYAFREELSVNTKEVVDVVADVSRLKGNLLLTVVPADAPDLSLSMDGGPISVGLTRGIMAGKHELLIQGEGWLYRGPVVIDAGATVKMTAKLLEVGTVSLTFPIEGTATLVASGGQETRLSSGVPVTVDVGTYELIVERPDFETDRRSITVERGGGTTLTVELKPTERYLLKLELAELRARRETLLRRRGVWPALAWTVTGMGVASGAVSLFGEAAIAWTAGTLDSTATQYAAAATAADTGALRAQMQQYEQDILHWRGVRTVSLVSAGVNLGAGLLLHLLSPRLESVEARIRELEGKLR